MSLKDKNLNRSYTHVTSPYVKQFIELWYEKKIKMGFISYE